MEEKRAKKVLPVEGMTCSACEMKIEKGLMGLEGVIEAKALYSSSNVYVTYNPGLVTLEKISETLVSLGYTVKSKTEKKSQKTYSKGEEADSGKLSINQLLGIGIIIAALYVIINNSVGFNFIPEVSQSMGYGILFAVGLMTSIHCIGMCGGINLSQCLSYRAEESKGGKFEKLKPSLLYNSGRLVSYTVIGGAAGALGSVVSFSGAAKGIVAIISGIFMIIMGLNMLNVFPWLRKINPRMPRILSSKIHKGQGNQGPFYIGLLNGFMPCGPLQAMQLYALGTGSLIAGALSMFFFSLGTIPLMFGLGAVSSLLSSRFTHKMLKVSGVLVMVLGLIMLSRGLNLSGFNIALASSKSGNVARLEGEVQVVSTKLESGRYTPIIVQKGIPVRWIIQVSAEDLNGCNNPVTIPKYNIQKRLVPGDNYIEFTPGEEGNIRYTCWMGMISSNIKVVSDIERVTEKDIEGADPFGSSGFGGGCCGG